MNKHKEKAKQSAKGATATIIAALLVIGAAAGVIGYGSNGFKDWSFKKFAQKTEISTPDKPNDSAVIITPDESNGIELCSAQVPVENYANYGIDPQSVENVYELSVTYTPADTTFQDTNYTLAFKNPNSTWATGKNIAEYAELQHESGSKNAVLTVKQAFSEQLVVRATNQRHTEISCTINVDYVCNYLRIGLNTGGGYHLAPEDDICLERVDDKYYKWSNGTIEPDTSNITLHVQLENYITGYTPAEYTYKLGDGELVDGDSLTNFNIILYSSYGYSNMSADEKTAFEKSMRSVYSVMSDGDYVGQYWFTYDRIYNGVDYGGVTTGVDLYDIDFIRDFDTYYEVSPTGMTSNNSHVVAG